MKESLRRKLEDWLEFYQDLEIDLMDRRPGNRPRVAVSASPAPSTAQKQSATTASAGFPEPTPVLPRTEPIVRPSAPGASIGLFDEPAVPVQQDSLERIREDMGDCRRCKLSEHRTQIVYGTGNPRAKLVFVGEAPGADEDQQGLPFVGRAGKLLNRLIGFVGMKREEVYICNIIKCRPPGNRTPEKDEIASCQPFVFRQISVIRPRLVCCLGSPALRTLLPVREGISKVRGRFFDYHEIKLLATFHPAYILRNPREEAKIREDFLKMRDFLATPA